MNLTLEQIRAAVFGAAETEVREDGLHCRKCTARQIDVWMREGEGLGKNATATTGNRLDFHTDSQHLTVCSHSGCIFELSLNGLLRMRLDFSDTSEITVDLSDFFEKDVLEKRRVTIAFPCHGSPGSIASVELDDGASFAPHVFDRKLLFIGDSITQGWDSGYGAMSYVGRVSEFFNAESVNQGIGGAYFLPESFDRINFEPDAVIVAYGTNDFGHYATQEEFYKQAKAHLRLIKQTYASCPIFVISPTWRGKKTEKQMGSFGECRAIVKRLAQELHLSHIDGFSLVPPLPELFSDGYLHPNANGFSFYAENLIRALLGNI